MKDPILQPQKKELNTPKNRQLLVDAILIVVSLVVPHASLPISIFAMIKIVKDFHESQKESEEE